ncbi:MAG: hypothetical protein GX640_02635, partial [Fibrobacter sp.]|nr:hypothetical protein [Fibrobacter sp.]
SGQTDSMIIRIESATGVVYASGKISGLTTTWKQFSTTLTSNTTDNDARLVVLTTNTALIDMDMISLFPVKTFKGRVNGLRADLAQKLADMNPGFMRFPGGCVVHSNNLATAYRWKGTIGPIEQRTTIPNRWGYLQSCGLGYFEYFQFCEDIGAEPLPVLPVGVSCHFKTPYEVVPMSEMQPWVDDALDLIEYANGPVTSTWGAKRAEAGHPEPFNLKYIAIGNEEWGPEFKARSDLFISAIRAKYPDIKIIGTAGPNVTSSDYTDLWAYNRSVQIDLVDEHYYMNIDWFKQNTKRYDSFNRNGPKVFAGEYASGTWTTTIKRLSNAIAEAAFMTGLERNSDVVLLSCYAPLFRAVHCNGKPAEQPWDPDLIYFNNNASYCTPSYYTQSMFSNNTGHVLVPMDIEQQYSDGPLFGVCSKDTLTSEIILKVVNISVGQMTYTIQTNGAPTLEKSATRIVLTSANMNDTNGFSQPQKVAPVTSTFDSVSSSFQYRFPGNSLTIFRFATRPPLDAQKIGNRSLHTGIKLRAGMAGANNFRVSFNLPKQSRVSARLIDSNGKNVATVIKGKQFNQGEHTFEWKTPVDKPVGTGMYIILLLIDGRVISAPLVRY